MGNVLTRKKNNQKGYTLAELLMVVAIVIILAAFGFVAVFRYQRTLKRTEMDNIAREIFVAAQNHLTASKATGAWGNYETEAKEKPGVLGERVPGLEGAVKEHDYFALDLNRADKQSMLGSSTMEYILPAGAIDETVRQDGYYVIEYDATAAAVYGVFYTDTLGKLQYSEPASEKRNDTAYRNANGIGYYGGATDESDAGTGLEAPVLSVRNAESLVLTIVDPNVDKNTTVELTIVGKQSKAKRDYPLELNTAAGKLGKAGYSAADDRDKAFYDAWIVLGSTDPITLANGKTVSTSAVYNIIFDSIVRRNGHFAELFAGSDFIPGEDITVTATVSSSDGQTLTASSSVTFNSLFEAVVTKDHQLTAALSNARHLENLNATISGVGTGVNAIQLETVEMTDDIAWKTDVSYPSKRAGFLDGLRDSNNRYGYQALENPSAEIQVYKLGNALAASAEKFAGLVPITYHTFTGNNHLLMGFDMEGGLFKVTGSLTEISNLLLADSEATGALADTENAESVIGNAGLLAAAADTSVKLEISNVGVYAASREAYKRGTYTQNADGSGKAHDDYHKTGALTSKVQADTNAGGLIGRVTGAVVITDCFASVPVYSEGGNAGGLVGQANGTIINNSYVGGFADKQGTITASSSDATEQTGAAQGSGEGKETAYLDYSTDSINVASPTGTAGGFIGDAKNVTARKSYTTASVYGKTAGGFIGVSSGANYDKTYTTARVYGRAASQGENASVLLGEFAGTSTGDTFTISAVLSYMNTMQDGVNAEYPTALLGNREESAVHGLEEKESDDLKKLYGEADTQQVGYTYAYQSKNAYPYPAVNATAQNDTDLQATAGSQETQGMGHHGDWPEGVKKTEGEFAFGLIYYEKIDGDTQVYYHGYLADGMGESAEHYQEVSTLDLQGKEGVTLPSDLNTHGLRTSADTYVKDSGYLFLIDPKVVRQVDQLKVKIGDTEFKSTGVRSWWPKEISMSMIGINENNPVLVTRHYHKFDGEYAADTSQVDLTLVDALGIQNYNVYSWNEDIRDINDNYSKQFDDTHYGIQFEYGEGSSKLNVKFNYREMFADSVIPDSFDSSEKEAYTDFNHGDKGYVVRSAKQLQQMRWLTSLQESDCAENENIIIEQQMDIILSEKADDGTIKKNNQYVYDEGVQNFNVLKGTYRGEKLEGTYRKLNGVYYTFVKDLQGTITNLKLEEANLKANNNKNPFIAKLDNGKFTDCVFNNAYIRGSAIIDEMVSGSVNNIEIHTMSSDPSVESSGFVFTMKGGTIEECRLDTLQMSNTGFVYKLEGGTIRKVNISDLTTSGYNYGTQAGFVFNQTGGTISDVQMKNVVTPQDGFVHSLSEAGKIDRCSIANLKAGINGFADTVSGTITNCQIYSESDHLDQDGYEQVTIGLVNDSNYYGNNYSHNGFVNTVNRGGIVSSCSVTGTVWAKDQATGFVQSNSGSVENCYANVILNENGWGAINGFVYNNAGTIEKSYVLGTVDSANHANGFVGTNAGTISNSYTAIWNVSVNEETTGDGQNVAHYDLFAPSSTTGLSHCYAMNQINMVKGNAALSNPDGVEVTTSLQLSEANETLGNASVNTVAYRELNTKIEDKGVYPYPANPDIVQYGDWGEIEEVQTEVNWGLLYYERIGNDWYYHGYGYTDQGVAEELQNKPLVTSANTFVDESGYIYILNKDVEDGFDVNKYGKRSDKAKPYVERSQQDDFTKIWDSQGYKVYNTDILISDTGNLYETYLKKSSSNKLYVNVGFADTVSINNVVPEYYSIRSREQFLSLGIDSHMASFLSYPDSNKNRKKPKIQIELDISITDADDDNSNFAGITKLGTPGIITAACIPGSEQRYSIIGLNGTFVVENKGIIQNMSFKNCSSMNSFIEQNRGTFSGITFADCSFYNVPFIKQNGTNGSAGTVQNLSFDGLTLKGSNLIRQNGGSSYKEKGEVADIQITNLSQQNGTLIYSNTSHGEISNIVLNGTTTMESTISGNTNVSALLYTNNGKVSKITIEDLKLKQMSLISSNTNTITGVKLAKAEITGTAKDPVYGLVKTNSGSVEDVTAENAELQDASFVETNNGISSNKATLQNMHFKAIKMSSTVSDYQDYSVVKNNEQYGTISNVLIEDYVTGGQGFVVNNSGNILNILLEEAKISANGFGEESQGTISNVLIYNAEIGNNGFLNEVNNSERIQNCTLNNAIIGNNGFLGSASDSAVIDCRIINAHIAKNGFAEEFNDSMRVKGCELYGNYSKDEYALSTVDGLPEFLKKKSSYQVFLEATAKDIHVRLYSIPELLLNMVKNDYKIDPVYGKETGRENHSSEYLLMVIGGSLNENNELILHETAGFVQDINLNKDTVQLSSVTGILLGTQKSAGFVLNNHAGQQKLTLIERGIIALWKLILGIDIDESSMGIHKCYANVLITVIASGNQEVRVSGFVDKNTGRIEDSYVLGCMQSNVSVDRAKYAGFANIIEGGTGWTAAKAYANDNYVSMWNGVWKFARSETGSRQLNGNVVIEATHPKDYEFSMIEQGVLTQKDKNFRKTITSNMSELTHKYGVYNTDPADTVFPYPSNGQMQHGDWPMASNATYSLTFDTNGGAVSYNGSSNDEEHANVIESTVLLEDSLSSENITENADGTFTLDLEEGTDLELSDLEPVREGYTFMGWKLMEADEAVTPTEEQTVLVTQYEDEAAANVFLAAMDEVSAQDDAQEEVVLGMEGYAVDEQSAVSSQEVEAALSTETTEEQVNYISTDTLTVEGDMTLTAVWTLDTDSMDKIAQLAADAENTPETQAQPEDTADQLFIEEDGEADMMDETGETEAVSEASQDILSDTSNVIDFPQEQVWETEADLLGVS